MAGAISRYQAKERWAGRTVDKLLAKRLILVLRRSGCPPRPVKSHRCEQDTINARWTWRLDTLAIGLRVGGPTSHDAVR